LADPRERKRILLRWAELIDEHAEELAQLESADVGHPITDARGVDVPGARNCIAWYAETIDKVYGEIAPTGTDALALIGREPVGVVGAVVPWNYPLIITAWKLGPALATGNSVVLKPAEQSPLTALALAELAAEAGLPDGVLNVVPGFGEEAGEQADDAEHAIALANGTGYGLAAAVWSSNITTAHRVARRLRAGTVWINTFDVSSLSTPFGGVKDSGHGRDRSLHALDAYTHLKTTWVAL
jgi:acyl-CoA reductase-like NAD-dependent aldehyde dehydrogenase